MFVYQFRTNYSFERKVYINNEFSQLPDRFGFEKSSQGVKASK